MAVLLALAVLHGLLFVASVPGILRSGADPAQRRLQLAFALLVPIVGPVITYAVHRSDRQLAASTDGRTPWSSVEESRYTGWGHDRPTRDD